MYVWCSDYRLRGVGGGCGQRNFPLSGKRLCIGKGRGCVLRHLKGEQRHYPCGLWCGEWFPDGETECRGKSDDGKAGGRSGFWIYPKRFAGGVYGRGKPSRTFGTSGTGEEKRGRRASDCWEGWTDGHGAEHFRWGGGGAVRPDRRDCLSVSFKHCSGGKCGG